MNVPNGRSCRTRPLSSAVAHAAFSPLVAVTVRRVKGVWATLNYRPFLIVLGLGLALRMLTMAIYFPGVMHSYDSPRFARVGLKMFDDYWMPAGYAGFLGALRLISDEFWVSIAVQHLLGLSVGIALFLVCVRLGVSRGWATVPAAAAVLSGDRLYLEHVFMADAFLIFMAAIGLAAVVRGLVPAVDLRWLLVAGVLLGASAVIRTPAFVLLVAAGACAAVWAGPTIRRKALSGGAVLGGAAILLGAYLAVVGLSNGRYAGFFEMRGWLLYARSGPFAECSRFTPPTGTRVLCEKTPPEQRPGAFYYVWDLTSVARRSFQPIGPETGEKVGAFGRRAILNQPDDYLVAVLTDLARYIEPSIGPSRGYSGQSRDFVGFGFRDPDVERLVVDALRLKYDGTRVRAPGKGFLEAYQNIMRVDRLLLATLMVLTLGGMLFARGPLGLGVFLFGLSAFGLYVVPVLSLSYDFRYGVTPETFIVVSGILSAVALLQRRAALAASG